MPREVQKMSFAVLIFSEGFGLCDQTNAIYQSDVYAENKIMKYCGSTERQFKKDTVSTNHLSGKYPNATQPYLPIFGS